MSRWVLPLLAMVAGALIPFQSGVNARLGRIFHSPLLATLLSFSGGVLLLIALLALFRPSLPSLRQLGDVPWYLYLGGPLGVAFVTCALVMVPRTGVANFLTAAIGGQVLVSMVVDHFGLFGPLHPVSPTRLAAAGMLILSVVLMNR